MKFKQGDEVEKETNEEKQKERVIEKRQKYGSGLKKGKRQRKKRGNGKRK